MKKIIQAKIFSIILILLFAGCNEDLLDKSPLDSLSPDSYFRNETEVDLAITGIYNKLSWNRFAEKDQFSDDLLLITKSEAMNFLNGTLTAYSSSFSDNCWNNYYEAIGRANLVLSNIETAIISKENDRNRYAGEALFLRSLYYFQLTYLFGDVPLIIDEPTTTPDEIFVSRNSSQEVLEKVEQDLLTAIEYLPKKSDKAYSNGRASKGAAQALLTKVYLYQKKWAEAAVVSKHIINSEIYELYDDYGELFLEQNEYNNEVIFDIAYVKDIYKNNIPQRYGAHYAPTLSLVEAYGYKDGTDFNPDTDYENDPFENRDPRLFANIWLPGQPLRGTGLISLPASSLDGPRKVTSLAVQKFIDFSDPAIDNCGTNFIIFRYADVLLMYAEAENEVNGPNSSVYDAVNKVRTRANIESIPDGLTKAEMREKIRNERRLELAMEGWRFFDIKRWDFGDQTLDKDIMGYDRTKLIDPENPETWEFNRVFIEERKWSSTAKNKYGYFFPIPGSEIDLNPNLSQNSGY